MPAPWWPPAGAGSRGCAGWGSAAASRQGAASWQPGQRSSALFSCLGHLSAGVLPSPAWFSDARGAACLGPGFGPSRARVWGTQRAPAAPSAQRGAEPTGLRPGSAAGAVSPTRAVRGLHFQQGWFWDSLSSPAPPGVAFPPVDPLRFHFYLGLPCDSLSTQGSSVDFVSTRGYSVIYSRQGLFCDFISTRGYSLIYFHPGLFCDSLSTWRYSVIPFPPRITL